MAKFLVLIAFYDGGNSFRRRNIARVISNWHMRFPEADICVCEQNPTEFFVGIKPDYVDHRTYSFDGAFNKCRLLNSGVQTHPDYDAYVMADGDVIANDAVVACIRENWDRASLVFPYGQCMYLKETDSRRILNGDVLTYGAKDHGVTITRQTGLCNVFSRKTYLAVGGFDEAFVGWGAEDDAFVVKCNRLVGQIWRNDDEGAIAYHLFHPASNTSEYINSDGYIANRKRCACMRRMSDTDLHDYITGAATLDSLVAKYERMGRLEVKLTWKCTPDSVLSIDTTIYDIDRSIPLTFTRVLETIMAEDGPEYTIHFIYNVLFGSITDLSEEQFNEITAVEARCRNIISSKT